MILPKKVMGGGSSVTSVVTEPIAKKWIAPPDGLTMVMRGGLNHLQTVRLRIVKGKNDGLSIQWDCSTSGYRTPLAENMRGRNPSRVN